MPYFALTSLGVYLIIWGLMSAGILPDVSVLFALSSTIDKDILFLFMGIAILLEGIIYLGFYIPGQMIAVLLVIGGAGEFSDILILTLVSLIAVTLSATINYTLGYLTRSHDTSESPIDWKKLLLSMIHINTLALALFEAGRKRNPKYIIGLVSILNLPYYLLMISVTYFFQDTVRAVSENPYYLLMLLIIWCIYSFWHDRKKRIIA